MFFSLNDVMTFNFDLVQIQRWLVVLRIYVASAVFQPYRDLEAGDNQSLKIQVAKPGIEPLSFCSESQELNHSATAAPQFKVRKHYPWICFLMD